MLEDYFDVPRAASLLNMRYIPTPTRHRSSSIGNFSDGEEEDDEEYLYMI
jgi:hypothetical protein